MHLLLALSLLSLQQPLPTLTGEFLSGRKATLPAAASGKVALLAFGFTYDSRFAVEAWVKEFRARFDKDPRVTFFEIPMIGGAARLGKWFIDSGMRRGTPQPLHENVITVYGGVAPWKKALAVDNPKHAYLVLLDRSGNVRWLHHGLYDPAAFPQLQQATQTLLAESPVLTKPPL